MVQAQQIDIEVVVPVTDEKVDCQHDCGSTMSPDDLETERTTSQDSSAFDAIVASAEKKPAETKVWVIEASLVLLVWAVVVLLAWAVMYFVLMPKCFGSRDCQHPGLPGGLVFDILAVLVLGFLGGHGINKTTGLPPLLGMLIAGYVLKNLLGQLDGIPAKTNSTLRNMALAIIMLRAGMGLNLKKLRENSVTTILLSFVPCVCEAATIAFVARFFFPSLSLPFAFMLGFCIADVSPAVTTPILLDFMSQNLGENKGIPSVLLAAGSVNSVVAIVLYSVCWEFAWTDSVSTDKLVEIITVKLILQIVGIGGMAGFILGRITEFGWRCTSSDIERFLLTFLVAMCSLFGFKHIGMGGGGTLAVVTLGATLQNTMQDQDIIKPVSDIMAKIWQMVGSVMLFTLLGASVNQSKLDANMLVMAASIIVIGLIGRSISVVGTTALMRDWNMKERAFAVVAQCPKATVQAALATVALDFVNEMIATGKFDANSQFTQNALETSNMILTTAVLSIIITAPTFAVLMVICGNKWLQRSSLPR
jgi:NhaP-type Na+/H+ or K+/H+ antiporter